MTGSESATVEPEERPIRVERSGEVALYDLTVTISEVELEILDGLDDPEQWLRDAIRHRAITSNVEEVLPITDEQLRESLTD